MKCQEHGCNKEELSDGNFICLMCMNETDLILLLIKASVELGKLQGKKEIEERK